MTITSVWNSNRLVIARYLSVVDALDLRGRIDGRMQPIEVLLRQILPQEFLLF